MKIGRIEYYNYKNEIPVIFDAAKNEGGFENIFLHLNYKYKNNYKWRILVACTSNKNALKCLQYFKFYENNISAVHLIEWDSKFGASIDKLKNIFIKHLKFNQNKIITQFNGNTEKETLYAIQQIQQTNYSQSDSEKPPKKSKEILICLAGIYGQPPIRRALGIEEPRDLQNLRKPMM